MLKLIEESTSDPLRVKHHFTAIVTRTTVTVVSPAEVDLHQFEQWVKEHATQEDDGCWMLEDEEVGTFDTCSDQIEDLVAEIVNYWHELGVSFTSLEGYEGYLWA